MSLLLPAPTLSTRCDGVICWVRNGICGFREGKWRYNDGIKQLMNCTRVAFRSVFDSYVHSFHDFVIHASHVSWYVTVNCVSSTQMELFIRV
jgi:hypothetical protein